MDNKKSDPYEIVYFDGSKPAEICIDEETKLVSIMFEKGSEKIKYCDLSGWDLVGSLYKNECPKCCNGNLLIISYEEICGSNLIIPQLV